MSSLEPNVQKDEEILRLSTDFMAARETLSTVNSLNSLLLSQHVRECETSSALSRSVSSIEEVRSKELNERTLEITDLHKRMEALKEEIQQKQEEIDSKENKMKDLSIMHTRELERLEKELSQTVSHHEATAKERDMIKEEVKAMNGVVEQETASLRFQLSTANMQLQQANEVNYDCIICI